MKKVYVVMQNDFPNAVFSTYESARDYIAVQSKRDNNNRRLYWHMHPLVLDIMEVIHDNSEKE